MNIIVTRSVNPRRRLSKVLNIKVLGENHLFLMPLRIGFFKADACV